MLSSLILACSIGACSGGVCTPDVTVEKEVTRTKIVSVLKERDITPVRKAVLRVRAREWRILRRR